MRRVEGFVLAGGRGRRMGVDKARVAWNGWPLAVVMAQRLLPHCVSVALVRKQQESWMGPDGRAIRVVLDGAEDVHPLTGIVAALRHAVEDLVLVVPCDLPHLTDEDITKLVDSGPAVARVGNEIQPLVAVLPREMCDELEEARKAGLSARVALGSLPFLELPDTASRDVDHWVGRGPVETLLARCPLATANRSRVAEGEVLRLAARGAVDPTNWFPRPE